MRKKITQILTSPVNNKNDFYFYGIDVMRDNNLIHSIGHEELMDDDDIVNGMMISESSQTVYPISQYIGIILSDEDADEKHQIALLSSYIKDCPEKYKTILEGTISRLQSTSKTTDGSWNRDEMRYYDSEVDTVALRNVMLKSIREKPIWRIFMPRKKYITDIIKKNILNKTVLEIGCGNSRTVSNVFSPSQNKYNYIGTDISFKRLLVAKAAVPEGDFIQSSALALPFIKNTFGAVLSFGMLHHLPRPAQAVAHCAELVSNNGFFCFHEPFLKPQINFPGIVKFRKAMSTYEHSEHDQKINLDEIKDTLTKCGFKTTSEKKQISTLRSLSETVIKKVSEKIIMNKKVINFISMTDEIYLSTFGKFSKRLGAGTILMVMKKSS